MSPLGPKQHIRNLKYLRNYVWKRRKTGAMQPINSPPSRLLETQVSYTKEPILRAPLNHRPHTPIEKEA